MSLLSKLLGRQKGDPYSEGIALFEAGKYDEAADHLRSIADAKEPGPRSLASFYLRQALVKDGRRLVAEGRFDDAVLRFDEAVEVWSTFPDLHFQRAVALGQADRWSEALAAARRALSLNDSFPQALLFEACALFRMGRLEDLATRIADLRAGAAVRRHDGVRRLLDAGAEAPETFWDGLIAELRNEVAGGGARRELESALDDCRAGRWEEGLVRLGELCAQSPDYPDYRVKYAATLFQTGRTNQALAEIDHALALNPSYRTAVHLKALVLADQRRYREAREVIVEHGLGKGPGSGHPGEELFGAYMRAVLAFVTGHPGEVAPALEAWGDLRANFPAAELLRAAAVAGDAEDCGARLADLVGRWPGDAEYIHQLACHQLRRLDLDGMAATLDHWPEFASGRRDPRLLLLRAHLALERDEELPGPARADDAATAAWRFLRARAALRNEDWSACLRLVRELADEGYASERLASLTLRVYLATGEARHGETPAVPSDAALAERLCRLHREDRAVEARAVLRDQGGLHPEDLRWTWLDPVFWLRPVRRWIG